MSTMSVPPNVHTSKQVATHVEPRENLGGPCHLACDATWTYLGTRQHGAPLGDRQQHASCALLVEVTMSDSQHALPRWCW